MHMYVQAKIYNFCGRTNMVVVTGNVMKKSCLKHIFNGNFCLRKMHLYCNVHSSTKSVGYCAVISRIIGAPKLH